MTRIGQGPLGTTSYDLANTTGSTGFDLTPTFAGQTSSLGGGPLINLPPLSSRRRPDEIYADTNVMTISQSDPVTITLDGREAAYNNSLGMVKLDDSGNVVGVVPVFADSSNPGQSVPIDLKKGERVAFMVIPDGGSSPETKALLSDPDADLALVNRRTGRPANLLTDNPEDIGLFSRGCNGQRTEIEGADGLTFSVKRNTNSPSPDGKGFNSADITIDPQTGKATVKMDDQWNGDGDKNDLNFTVDLGPANARALLPRPGGNGDEPELPRTYGDIAGVDRQVDLDELTSALNAVDGRLSGRANDRIGASEWNEIANILGFDRNDLAYFKEQGIRSPEDLAETIIEEADKDGDGRASRAELRALKKAIDGIQGDEPPETPETFRELAGRDRKADFNELAGLLEGIDGMFSGEANGRLNSREWEEAARVLRLGKDDLAYFRSRGIRSPADLADAILEMGDTDRDGKVSRREMRALKKTINEAQEDGKSFAPLPKTFADLAGLEGGADAGEIGALLRRADGSGSSPANGRLGRAEWNNVSQLLSLGRDDYDFLRSQGARSAEDIAEKLVEIGDQNGDGKLDQAEVRALAGKIDELRAEEDGEA